MGGNLLERILRDGKKGRGFGHSCLADFAKDREFGDIDCQSE